ncbi:hypothetical protein [Alkalilacustris brevis]|uniref:hypothetical protein n=1 Tax=Alkalilacustris brevis TaxID=2026338 RepID=UPI000E0D6C64|nr:hypothetical protein [Alkalilacustris brevis]
MQRPDRDEQAFAVQVRSSTNILDADGAAVEIVPGMVAQVDILAGRKRVLHYISQPWCGVRPGVARLSELPRSGFAA